MYVQLGDFLNKDDTVLLRGGDRKLNLITLPPSFNTLRDGHSDGTWESIKVLLPIVRKVRRFSLARRLSAPIHCQSAGLARSWEQRAQNCTVYFLCLMTWL